jgi:hypothetical protein
LLTANRRKVKNRECWKLKENSGRASSVDNIKRSKYQNDGDELSCRKSKSGVYDVKVKNDRNNNE